MNFQCDPVGPQIALPAKHAGCAPACGCGSRRMFLRGALAAAAVLQAPAVLAQTVVGTGFFLTVAWFFAYAARRWFLVPPPSTTAPPTGTPVAAASTTGGTP